MKTLEELDAIRKRTLERISLRKEDQDPALRVDYRDNFEPD